MCLYACSEAPQPPPPVAALDQAAPTHVDSAIAARLPRSQISTSELDDALRIALADLDMQRFRLRRDMLEGLALEQLTALPSAQRTAEILLEPPEPPLLAIEPDPRRVRPDTPAPVTIIVFCNFESPHCTRFEITVSEVLPLFSNLVRVAARDLPLPFHRSAELAAEAARCAADQGRFWAFHDLLYARRSGLDEASLRATAALASLDLDTFSKCLESGSHAASIAVDVSAARDYGIDTVPAVFVNGRYLSPPVYAADLVWRIETELDTQGIASPRRTPADRVSAQRIEVHSVLHSSTPGQGVALLSTAGSARAQIHREGDSIGPLRVLRRVFAGGIELWHDGSIETLALGNTLSAVQTEALHAAENEANPVTPHRAVPVPLDRDHVLVLLSERIALETALEPVPMTAGGQRLLRVAEVASGSLYELLGFEPGDVLLGVNEQPVLEGSNPLWDALEREKEVRVRVIRPGGLARHFTFRFDE